MESISWLFADASMPRLGSLLRGCGLGLAFAGALSGCTDKTPAQVEVTPPAWASYEHVYDKADACGEFSQEQAQSVLGVDTELLVTDVDDRKSVYGEAVYATCTFSNPENHENQLVYQRQRLVGRTQGEPTAGVMYHRSTILHRTEENRAPYVDKYPGFGVHTKMDKLGHQSAMWMCGNQSLHVGIRVTGDDVQDRSRLLWKTLEPIVVKHCGTKENPATILADDNGRRRDATEVFAKELSLDIPAVSSSTGQRQPEVPIPNPTFTDNIKHHREVRDCSMLSVTQIAELTGRQADGVRTFGYAGTIDDWQGDWTVCTVKVSGVRSPGDRFLRFESSESTSPSHRVEQAEELAIAYADRENRAPYASQYHGFGVLTVDEKDSKKRSVTWDCANLRISMSVNTAASKNELSSGDVWGLAEPMVKRQCGPVDRPQTVLLDVAGRRVNYTKLLMEDWKIGSEAQLTSPPAVKRYQLPTIASD